MKIKVQTNPFNVTPDRSMDIVVVESNGKFTATFDEWGYEKEVSQSVAKRINCGELTNVDEIFWACEK